MKTKIFMKVIWQLNKDQVAKRDKAKINIKLSYNNHKKN
jgi:hypothetical protein